MYYCFRSDDPNHAERLAKAAHRVLRIVIACRLFLALPILFAAVLGSWLAFRQGAPYRGVWLAELAAIFGLLAGVNIVIALYEKAKERRGTLIPLGTLAYLSGRNGSYELHMAGTLAWLRLFEAKGAWTPLARSQVVQHALEEALVELDRILDKLPAGTIRVRPMFADGGLARRLRNRGFQRKTRSWWLQPLRYLLLFIGTGELGATWFIKDLRLRLPEPTDNYWIRSLSPCVKGKP